MKRNTITTNIGTINLNDVEFIEDSLDIIIGIESVSEDIQKKVNEAAEIAKALELEHIKQYHKNKKLTWSTDGTDTNLSLSISLENKTITYSVDVFINDKVNDISADASIIVDLSEYEDELKKIIVKAMVDKFF
ncbi:MAG: hypothetical protein NC485_15125 [Ruminococcus flavefaciens]|nr:hypothetical protein [Ruminococcus flavefaciens]